MKFNVFFTLRGPARTIEAPNQGNPVEVSSLTALLVQLAQSMPRSPEIEVIGIRVVQSAEELGTVKIVTESQMKNLIQESK